MIYNLTGLILRNKLKRYEIQKENSNV